VDTTKPQQANKVKNYGQTIQQSHQTETPAELHQTQKSRGQSKKGHAEKGGLNLRFRKIEKAVRLGGLFTLAARKPR
jgi:hypothetical protein